jgi:hypothetical protein
VTAAERLRQRAADVRATAEEHGEPNTYYNLLELVLLMVADALEHDGEDTEYDREAA